MSYLDRDHSIFVVTAIGACLSLWGYSATTRDVSVASYDLTFPYAVLEGALISSTIAFVFKATSPTAKFVCLIVGVVGLIFLAAFQWNIFINKSEKISFLYFHAFLMVWAVSLTTYFLRKYKQS